MGAPVREDTRLSLWRRVRAYAVPPTMIETATARRLAGDWAGACAAAGVDLDLTPRTLARTHGTELAARVRADLRRLAPDLLRWHLPRTAPDGLLRPGTTVTLAVYADHEHPAGHPPHPIHLVARTAPAWAEAGQRISLTLWHAPPTETARARRSAYASIDSAPNHFAGRDPDPESTYAAAAAHPSRWNAYAPADTHPDRWGEYAPAPAHPRRWSAYAPTPAHPDRWNAYVPATAAHPHPHPSRRFRFDLHRHLWDATRADELRTRSGADRLAALPATPDDPPGPGWAVDRWAAEARLLLAAEGRPLGPVLVRLGARHRILLTPEPDGGARTEPVPTVRGRYGQAGDRAVTEALPVLPDAATWTPPDLALLRAGLVTPDDLHPLVAEALAPDHRQSARRAIPEDSPRLIECQGSTHRIGLVDGVLAPLDHDPAELRHEELLVALAGTPLPCLRAIDEAHRRPDCLTGVRERLAHGDTAGALAVVEDLLGPGAALRDGPLRQSLERAAERKILHGLYRAGLRATGPEQAAEPPPPPVPDQGRPRPSRSLTARAARRAFPKRTHPRHAQLR
ncbi:hypothetical protein [Streptomyces sp. NPDC058486]|uniref:hypothetical protein n=1 Tax=unclassified Streptomyces TaxID=2593676 RepID=UPI003664A9F9